jgi:hypothetical protein
MLLKDYLFHFSSIFLTRRRTRQVIFRNSNTSGAGLYQLLRMRRHRSDRASPFKRIFSSLLLGFFTLSTFLVASIFSSRVAASSSVEVLVSSLNCGFLFKRGYIYSPDFASADFAHLDKIQSQFRTMISPSSTKPLIRGILLKHSEITVLTMVQHHIIFVMMPCVHREAPIS